MFLSDSSELTVDILNNHLYQMDKDKKPCETKSEGIINEIAQLQQEMAIFAII